MQPRAAPLMLQECVGGDPAEGPPQEESCLGPSLGGCGWELRADLHVPGMCREPRPCSMGSYPPIAQVKKPRLSEWPKLHCMARVGSVSQGALAESPQATHQAILGGGHSARM